MGPMLNASVEGYYSNFWGAMNEKVGSTLNKIELFFFFAKPPSKCGFLIKPVQMKCKE